MDPQLWEEIARGQADGRIDAIVRLRTNMEPPENLELVARFGAIATCRLRRADILEIRNHPSVISLKASRGLSGDVDPSIHHEDQKAQVYERRDNLRETGAGVIVGVIDYGCDFAHDAFVHPDGTSRILKLWDQRIHSDRSRLAQPYGRGRVFDQTSINRALQEDNPYAELNYHPAPSHNRTRAMRGSHGTHVLDIAAGNGRGRAAAGMAPDADILFVHVASGNTDGLRNFGDSVGVLEAIDFIRREAGDRPVVINISMGKHGGPHDGSSLLELAMDQALSRSRGFSIVQSAGNYYDRNIHAEGRLRRGGTSRMGWLVPESDTTKNELEIWYSGRDRFDLEIFAPGNDGPSFNVAPGERVALRIEGEIVGRAYHRLGDPNNRDNHIDIFLYENAPKGEWDVALAGRRIRNGRFHGWIERDGSQDTQSTFSYGNITPRMTCGTIANGRRPIQVAAHRGRGSFSMTDFSSAGPTRDGRRVPLLSAPGFRIRAARSAVRGLRSTHRESTVKSGTSMAAPYVTGLVALMLQAQPNARQRDLRRALRVSANRDVVRRTRGGSIRSRWGAVRPEQALRYARRMSVGRARENLQEQDLNVNVSMNAQNWALVRNWVQARAVPLNGASSLSHNGASVGVALPADPTIASFYVAQALINIELVRNQQSALPMPRSQSPQGALQTQLSMAVIAAMPIASNEWPIIGRFIERAQNARRDGTASRVLFDDHDMVNKANLAHQLACHRLGGNTSGRAGNQNYCAIPNSSPHDPAIDILIREFDRIGPLIDWTMKSMEERRVYLMHKLVTVHRYSRNAAAGLVGNFEEESGLMPERIEGSRRDRPRSYRTSRRPLRYRRYSLAEIKNRNRSGRNTYGPRLAGVGLAQWTSGRRRRGFFAHRFQGQALDTVMLFAIDAQLDYMRSELARGFARVERVLRRTNVSLNDASDEVCYVYERPGTMFEQITRPDGTRVNGPLLRRTDPQVQDEFNDRRSNARAALDAYNRAHPAPTAPADNFNIANLPSRRPARSIGQTRGVSP